MCFDLRWNSELNTSLMAPSLSQERVVGPFWVYAMLESRRLIQVISFTDLDIAIIQLQWFIGQHTSDPDLLRFRGMKHAAKRFENGTVVPLCNAFLFRALWNTGLVLDLLSF